MREIIFILFLILAGYLMIRSQKTFNLQIRVIDGAYGYLKYLLDHYKDDQDFSEHIDEFKSAQSKVEELVDRYSFPRMTFDFRPITLEAWYEEDEVNLIKRYENYK